MPHHGGQGTADPELTAMLAAIAGPGGEFRHRQHIHLAFLAVRRYGMPEATGKVCTWIRSIAAYERAPQKYHHTVSRAWVELIAHHVAAEPECVDFDAFARRNPALLDKRLLSGHYRSSTLAARAARHGWVEPDLLLFPPGLRRHISRPSGLLARSQRTQGPRAHARRPVGRLGRAL